MEQDNQQHIPQDADTFSLGSGLSVYTKADTQKVIEVTNNRAHYFANLAKKFRDEAKLHCENAKHYAEENSNVTYDQLIDLRNVLETKINTKQDSGNYALQQDIPVNVSDLENDSGYITTNEAETLVNTAVPEQEGNAGKFLHTDGNSTSWVDFPSETMFSIKTFDHVLDFEESKGYALQGTWVYKSAATERYGYPDFYAKCLLEKSEAGEGVELTMNNLTATIYNHSNGHQFYDIEDKSVFDTWSEANTGIWAYGIDVENERILLPKRKMYYTNFSAASNSSKVDNNRYQYVVVGNTEDEQVSIEVLPITTSESDTIPMFTGMYFDFKPNNPSWLKAGEQKNNGGIYTSCYNTLVNCLTEANNIYNLKVIEISDMVSSIDYSEYWKVNQDDMYFITPTKISLKAYKSNASVNGNGMTIGLYGRANNVSQNFGMIVQSARGISGATSSYGSNADSPQGLEDVSGGWTVGLTSDPQKSGIVANLKENSTAQLYFKVANAVQNQELLNVGNVLESLAGKVDVNSNVLTGQWVFNQIELTNSTAAVQTLDLSEYLPQDSYNYEVMFTANSYSDANSDICKWVYTDLMPHNVNWYDTWNNTNTRHTANSFTYPVGAERKIYIAGGAPKTYLLFAKGYRRLGTNC